MRELTELLEATLRETRFDAGPYGSFTGLEMRAIQTQGNRSRQLIAGNAKAVIPEARLAQLAERLADELQDYVESESQRVGTGLISLMGGALDQAEPTITEFARTLVDAASILGPVRAVEILQGWTAGEPYRFRMNMILTGVRCDRPLVLEEGVRVMQLPRSSDDLATHLPSNLVSGGFHSREFLGRAVLVIDGTAGPALYRPDPEPGDRPMRRLDQVWARGEFPCMTTDSWRERFTEALSLASDHCVSWTHIWRDVGDVRAFNRHFGSHEVRDEPSRGGGVSLQLEHLEHARDIDVRRHANVKNRKTLDMAISRWINSKRPHSSLADRFIELRIAFEALYLAGIRDELRLRLASYAAWHLGADFNERRRYFRLIRDAYDRGSAAVHAGDVDDTPDNRKLLSDAQRGCREAILKRLAETEEPRPWDEVALGSLAREVSS